MNILFIAMANSIHTARWISQLGDTGWDIHVFDAMESDLIPEFTGVTAYTFYRPQKSCRNVNKVHYIAPSKLIAGFIRYRFSTLGRLVFPSRIDTLTELIQRLKPDILHSMEMQNESYPLMEVRRRLGGNFPMPWIYSSWGSDLYFFGKQPGHEVRIREVLGACDYYIADCFRDVEAADKFGFKGQILGVLPASGGLDVESMRKLMQPGPVSTRRIIALKGYQNWASRALIALQALGSCADVLKGYNVIVYGAQPGVRKAALELSKTTGIRIEVLKRVPYEAIIRLLGSSRIAIGVGISDGTPLSMLEAMVMGALPIQSDTVSTAEWIDDGKNGLLVPPEDPDKIAIAIRRSLSDNELVDRAAEINSRTLLERIDKSVIQPSVISMYEKVASSPNIN